MGQFCTKIIVHNQNGEQEIIPVDNDDGQSPYQQFKKSINIYLRNTLLAKMKRHTKVIIKKEVEVWDYEAPLHDALPALTQDQIYKILYFIRNNLINLINQQITACNLNSNHKDNFTFLYLLNKSRDWKSECVVCLGEIGKTDCCCDHKETVIMRPCGHSMCQRPCFNNYMVSKDIPITPMKIVHHGQQYLRPHVMDISKCTGFPCPTCRTDVVSCFRAEDISIEDTMIQSFIEIFNANNGDSVITISNDKTEEELQYEKESNTRLYELFSECAKLGMRTERLSLAAVDDESQTVNNNNPPTILNKLRHISDDYWLNKPPIQQVVYRARRIHAGD